ncbi:phosphodiesterase [Vibrio marisflavi]|uniref:Phosphoesterase n=1 Tax=Vibrio marisflavi CECT 7928 TaxID=634439 RepID=A0ABN8E4N3_9VIBR|nr:phosphodiesterase [Vibrio marisflavi]CAH0539033.1 Phosphodiesterase YfcE [Vibrio marisflavi CECT 7928]
MNAIFFAADIHGSLPAATKLLSAFEASGASQLVLLGDILNHGPRNSVPVGYDPAEVANKLNEYSDRIIAVRGNCDSEVDQMLLDFPMMVDYSWLLLESGKRMFITHGHIYNMDNRPKLAEGDILVCGHTHIPVAERYHDIYVINPGSITFPRGYSKASYAIYSQGAFKVMSFDGKVVLSTNCN